MNEAESIPKLGQLVRIIRGREAGQFAIVIKIIDNLFVLLADGDKRKYDRPKKKNIRHIELMDYISPEIQNSLLNNGRVTNGKLRFAIDTFSDQYDWLDEGRQNDGERRSN